MKRNIIASREGQMSIYSPESADGLTGGECLGGAYSDGAQPGDGPWVVFTGDGFKRSQLCIAENASDARDALEKVFGSLKEVDVE